MQTDCETDQKVWTWHETLQSVFRDRSMPRPCNQPSRDRSLRAAPLNYAALYGAGPPCRMGASPGKSRSSISPVAQKRFSTGCGSYPGGGGCTPILTARALEQGEEEGTGETAVVMRGSPASWPRGTSAQPCARHPLHWQRQRHKCLRQRCSPVLPDAERGEGIAHPGAPVTQSPEPP